MMDQPNINICVVILTINQAETTLECLRSLQQVRRPHFHTLLWDNGSDDNTESLVRRDFPAVMVHRHDSNLGVASGRNAAAKLAIERLNPTHLLFLDNDMVVEANFVGGLLKPFLDDERVGQTQAKLRFMDRPDVLNDGGGARINYVLSRIRPIGYGEVDRGQYDRPAQCISCGGAMMVRRDVFQALEGFDSTFDPFGPEDLDFSLRLKEMGYQAWYIPQAVAYHRVSHTFGRDYDEDYARHKSNHWMHFMGRHATIYQKVAFAFIGAPYLALKVVFREMKKGNLGAIRGLIRGFVDYNSPARQAGRE